jgi:glycosyltransferase involved in cell wall biosynthesis
MSASVITFANLGKKADVSAADIMPVIRKFVVAGELKQVIGKTNRDFDFINTASAVPLPLHYSIRVLQKFLKVPFARKHLETLFDFIAQWRLQRSDVIFFHGGFVFPRTLRRAKQLGAITVDIPRLAHLERNAELEKEEMELLGITQYDEYYAEQSRRLRHLNDFDYIVAFSDFVKSSYVEHGYPSERVFIAPQDIDVRFFNPAVQQNDVFRVIYVAYSNPLKGLHYLLDAWKNLHIPNSELVLVGGYGAMPEQLRKQYDLIIENNSTIKQVNHTDNKELQRLYQSSSVLVFPSLTESLSRVTVEAMACGLPLITTEKARGLVEDEKSGFVVPIRDSESIREKIEYLYNNPDVRERMGREARKAVENKKPFGEAVYEIYQEIMRREGKL